jgi:L-2-hydroxyglutarate oxidase LhgO
VDLDVAIIGGGVVGLASALALAERGATVCVLERESRLGHATSTRNSGVIHAGLYYPAGSLKATLCVEGRDRLYAFAAAHDIPHQRCGKLVVATTTDELDDLERLHQRARGNGVTAEIVDPIFIRSREPHVVGATAALWSPDTGIVQAEAYVKTLARLCSARDVALLVGSPLLDARAKGEGIELVTPHETIDVRTVVNAAGLHADTVSRMLGGMDFTIYPCRGEYVELTPRKRSWVNGLIYPLPHGVGLGVHFVRTTWGSVLLGPTTSYQQSRDDYESNRLPTEAFLEPAQKLLPELTLSDLQPGGTGIRAKLHGPDQTFADFIVEPDRRNPAVIQAAGIDSPGLTSSLAIGELVGRIWAQHLARAS